MSWLSKGLRKVFGKKNYGKLKRFWKKNMKYGRQLAAVVLGYHILGPALGLKAAGGTTAAATTTTAGAGGGFWASTGNFFENIWKGVRGKAAVAGTEGSLVQQAGHATGSAIGAFTEEGRMLNTMSNPQTIGMNNAAGYVSTSDGQGTGFGNKFQNFLGQYGGAINLYGQYEAMRSQRKLGEQMMAMAQQKTESQLRFRRDMDRIDAILSTPPSELSSKFGKTTLLRYGINPELVEAEALQARAERRREVESVEDASGRAAARAGMFSTGALGGLQASLEAQATSQDAALALAAERTFSNQVAALQQQYQQGQIMSMNMDAQQQIAIQQAMGVQQRAEQNMWDAIAKVGQKGVDLYGAGKPPPMKTTSDNKKDTTFTRPGDLFGGKDEKETFMVKEPSLNWDWRWK